jgi:ferrous iron transport protein A
MTLQTSPLSDLPIKTKGKIRQISGGDNLNHKLQVMGIREDRNIFVVSKQPFRGPITIKVCGAQMTLGRGMAKKILVEVIP